MLSLLLRLVNLLICPSVPSASYYMHALNEAGMELLFVISVGF